MGFVPYIAAPIAPIGGFVTLDGAGEPDTLGSSIHWNYGMVWLKRFLRLAFAAFLLLISAIAAYCSWWVIMNLLLLSGHGQTAVWVSHLPYVGWAYFVVALGLIYALLAPAFNAIVSRHDFIARDNAGKH